MKPKPIAPWVFDIDRAIETWSQFVSRERSIRKADLEELEIHLRDEWEALVCKGLDSEKAFQRAQKSVGSLDLLSSAYKEVGFEKTFKKGQFKHEARARLTMAFKYVQGAFREIFRHPVYASLNIVGLSLAFCSAIIIGLFILHSLSFDVFHTNSERTFRISQFREQLGESARPSAGIADLVRAQWPGAELVTEARGQNSFKRQFTVRNEHFMIDGVLSVDADFLSVFSFPIKTSSSEHPLESPQTIAITESLADQLFGDSDPLGQTIRYDASSELTVSAVLFDPPSNTHLPFRALVRSFVTPTEINWNRWGVYTYVVLNPKSHPEDLEAFLQEQFEAARPGPKSSFLMLPITEVYLNSGANDDYAPTSSPSYLMIFGSIGLFILLMASINYMNLASARASKREREVGVRKAVGASKMQIRYQFLTETLFLTSLSMILACVLVFIFLPVVNGVIGASLSIKMANTPTFWLVVICIVLMVSAGAGSYPAFLLALDSPSANFSGARFVGSGKRAIRRTLVGIQVAISFSLIVTAVLVSSQLSFIRKAHLGFDQEQIITIAPRGWNMSQFNSFKAAALQSSSIESVALGPPLGMGWRSMGWSKKLEDSEQDVQIEVINVGVDFFATMKMELVEGRFFQQGDSELEKPPFIVTESYAALFGKGESMIGYQSELAGPVVGIVKDFRNTPFTRGGDISTFTVEQNYTGTAVVRLAAGNISNGLEVLQEEWAKHSPDRMFEFEFLDDKIQAQYSYEMKLAGIFNLFSGLSVLIASLGLFGLASFTTQQRSKEISIRKVMGASDSNIVFLLSKEFLLIVILGVLFASPLMYVVGTDWLANFTSHITLGLATFATAALTCFVFVLVPVSGLAFRAAGSNPTKALRCD